MATVSLPAIPKEAEFEELIAALLQCSGLYVERQIEEQERGVQVLELDVITSDYRGTPPEVRIHEAKSGGWGIKEIFKVGGWMRYLKIDHGSFVVHDDPSPEKAKKCGEVANSLGINFVPVSEISQQEDIQKRLADRVRYDPLDVSIWRFSYWLERRMLDKLVAQRKSGPARYQLLFNQARAITNGVFFQPTIAEQLDTLYDVYKEHPHLSAVVASEIETGTMDREAAEIPQAIFRRTFYDCEDNAVQTAALLEHRARLAVMKAGIDYLLYRRAGDEDRADKVRFRLKMGGKVLSFSEYDSLPRSFRDGMEQIKDDPYVHLYPVFWQWFMWAFGGFILTDVEAQEYEALAERTGIPSQQIPRALAAYDAVFPMSRGWFFDGKHANMRMLRLFPIPFQGIGAHMRRRLHTATGEIADLPVKGAFTRSDLGRWINVVVSYLTDSR